MKPDRSMSSTFVGQPKYGYAILVAGQDGRSKIWSSIPIKQVHEVPEGCYYVPAVCIQLQPVSLLGFIFLRMKWEWFCCDGSIKNTSVKTRNRNPHSADQKHTSSSPVRLSWKTWTETKMRILTAPFLSTVAWIPPSSLVRTLQFLKSLTLVMRPGVADGENVAEHLPVTSVCRTIIIIITDNSGVLYTAHNFHSEKPKAL